MIEMFHRAVMGGCIFALAMIVFVVSSAVAGYAWRRFKGRFHCGHAVVMIALAAVATWAAQKVAHRVDVAVLNADPSRPALTANHSRIDIDATNETQTAVISFTVHPMVPPDANYYLDYRAKGLTNAADWVNFAAFHVNAEYPLPREIPIPWTHPATNYDWVVYTDWTPGPAVVTNGVWHAYWGCSTNRLHIIPVNTAIVNEPPKEPWGAQDLVYKVRVTDEDGSITFSKGGWGPFDFYASDGTHVHTDLTYAYSGTNVVHTFSKAGDYYVWSPVNSINYFQFLDEASCAKVVEVVKWEDGMEGGWGRCFRFINLEKFAPIPETLKENSWFFYGCSQENIDEGNRQFEKLGLPLLNSGGY